MATPAKKVFQVVPLDVERTGKAVLDAAFKVHAVLGPGLLESVYKTAMTHVLRKGGALVETEVALPIMFEENGLNQGCGWICALINASSLNLSLSKQCILSMKRN